MTRWLQLPSLWLLSLSHSLLLFGSSAVDECPPLEGPAWRGDWPQLTMAAMHNPEWGVAGEVLVKGWKASAFSQPSSDASHLLIDSIRAYLQLSDTEGQLSVYHAYPRQSDMAAKIMIIMATEISATNVSDALAYVATCESIRAELMQHVNETFTAGGRHVPGSINVVLDSLEVRSYASVNWDDIIAIPILALIFGMGSVLYLSLWKGGSDRLLCPVEETNWETIVIRREDTD